MRRLWLLALFFACFVVDADSVQGQPKAKLSSEELAQRRQKIGDDPALLLELCPLADDVAAANLRELAGKLLMEPVVANRAELANKVALILGDAARTPEQVRQILGPPQMVSRQIVYKRYLEQWTYDHPLQLCLIWSVPHGEGWQLQSVRPIRKEKH
jgi:hypothetical protein